MKFQKNLAYPKELVVKYIRNTFNKVMYRITTKIVDDKKWKTNWEMNN